MDVTLHRFDLSLRHRFTISRGSKDVQPTLIVQLSHAGLHGFGEATSNAFYGATIDNMVRSVESVRDLLRNADPGDPPTLWEKLNERLDHDSFALCAIDQAAYDLWGKLAGRPVWQLLGLTTDNLPVSNYTISIGTIEEMLARLDEFSDWPVYKIKLGTDRDVEIIRRLREHTEATFRPATFRVDANCGWTADQTIRHSGEFKKLGVEFIEQPLPPEDWSSMQRVFAESALPVIADESCQKEADIGRCAECFHGVNIKLVKCGGITPARRMIAAARQHGLKVMIGCMTESTVGISAIAQLLPLLDYVDMDGAALLASDIASGAEVIRGVCHYPAKPGTGVELLNPAVRS